MKCSKCGSTAVTPAGWENSVAAGAEVGAAIGICLGIPAGPLIGLLALSIGAVAGASLGGTVADAINLARQKQVCGGCGYSWRGRA
jgi:hypothetical protein